MMVSRARGGGEPSPRASVRPSSPDDRLAAGDCALASVDGALLGPAGPSLALGRDAFARHAGRRDRASTAPQRPRALLPPVELERRADPKGLAHRRGLSEKAAEIAASREAARDAQDRLNLRHLMRDLVRAAGAPAPRRPDAMRDALADHPELIEWLIARRDLVKLADEARLPSAIDHPPLIEMLRLFGALEDKALGRHPLVEGAIDLIGRGPRRAALALIPDALFHSMAELIEGKIERLTLAEEEVLQVILDPDLGIDLSGMPDPVRLMLEDVLCQYFDALPLEDRRKLVIALLDTPHDAPWPDQLGAILFQCPPGIQKLFQQIGRDSRSELLERVLARLEDEVPPMRFSLVRRIVERSLRQPLEALFASFSKTPIGSATMGQAHRATLHDGREVVVKVLRPGLERRIRAEFKALTALSHDPRMRSMLAAMGRSILDEADLRIEARNMRASTGYDRPRDGVHLIQPIDSIPATRQVLVEELAPGRPIDKITPEDAAKVGISLPKLLEIKGAALTALFRAWLENASFAHTDPHPGNVYLDLRPKKAPPFRITLIDYGSATFIPWNIRRGVSFIAAGAAFHQRWLVDQGMSKILPISAGERARVDGAITEILKTPKSCIEKAMDILTLLAASGLELPPAAVQLNRGRDRLERQLRAVNDQLAKLDAGGPKERFPVKKIYRRAALMGALRGPVAGLARWACIVALTFFSIRQGGFRDR